MDQSPEERLLLYVARISMSEDMTREIKEIVRRGLDWDYFTKRANREGIAPLAYWNFRKMGMKDVIPHAVMERLQQDYRATLCFNIIRFKELGDLLRALNDDEIERSSS